jgi:hypothetical protein
MKVAALKPGTLGVSAVGAKPIRRVAVTATAARLKVRGVAKIGIVARPVTVAAGMTGVWPAAVAREVTVAGIGRVKVTLAGLSE